MSNGAREGFQCLFREAKKNSSFLCGQATKRGWGVKGRPQISKELFSKEKERKTPNHLNIEKIINIYLNNKILTVSVTI